MDQLLQIRFKLLDALAQLTTERLKIESMMEATLKFLKEIKASQKEMNKKRNLPTMMMTKTQNRLGFIKE